MPSVILFLFVYFEKVGLLARKPSSQLLLVVSDIGNRYIFIKFHFFLLFNILKKSLAIY